jgi:hypothetical protein
LHTLQSKVTPTIVSGQYVVTCIGADLLKQGDLYNDNLVDIVDFGVFIGQWPWTGGFDTPCPTSGFHADMNANGGIDVGDYGFITGNFLVFGDPGCCTGGFRGDEPQPRLSITMAEALELGLPAWVDLNQDGVLDTQDVEAFLNGTVPDPTPIPDIPPAIEAAPAVPTTGHPAVRPTPAGPRRTP